MAVAGNGQINNPCEVLDVVCVSLSTITVVELFDNIWCDLCFFIFR